MGSGFLGFRVLGFWGSGVVRVLLGLGLLYGHAGFQGSVSGYQRLFNSIIGEGVSLICLVSFKEDSGSMRAFMLLFPREPNTP